jgi:hypothetical protein
MALGAMVAVVLEKASAPQASELWLEALAFFVGQPAVVLVGGSEEFKAKGDEMHGKIAAILADSAPESATAAHGLFLVMKTRLRIGKLKLVRENERARSRQAAGSETEQAKAEC